MARRPTYLKILLLGGLFCLISTCGFSQKLPQSVSFERITIPGTIRSSQATYIIQDRLGLIWVAGHGLYRYDGFKFKAYKEIADRPEGFNPQDILCLLYDSVGHRILIGTRRFGILEYSYQTDLIRSLNPERDQPIINQLAQTSDGKIWAASYNSGLFQLDGDRLKEIETIQNELTHPTTLLADGKRLMVGEIGRILIMVDSTVADEIRLEWEGHPISPNNHITAIAFDRNRNIWMGTEKNGVIVYDEKQNKFVKYFPPTDAPFYGKITDITEDKRGFIWILTKSDGAVLYSPTEDRFIDLRRDPFSQNSISSDNCFSILSDRDGVIWLGATGDLNKFDHDQKKFEHIYHNPLDEISLSDNMVRGIREDRLGNIWIGTDGGFVNILNPRLKKLKQLHISLPNDSSNYVPLYFEELNDNIMLIGSSSGVLQFDRRTKRFSHFAPLERRTKGRLVRQILKHNNSLLFIYAGCLHTFDLDTEELIVYKTAGSPEAFNVTSIYVDNRERIWLGCNKGVSLFDTDRKTFRFVRFENLPVATDGSLLLVLSIEQLNNTLYVGTFNAGLWTIDISNTDNLVANNYDLSDGLPSMTIYSTLPDHENNLWLSTNSGIVKLEVAKKRFVTFSIAEGLQEEEFNRLAYLRTRDGKIMFGGINGVNMFDPKNINIHSETLEPEILSLTFDNPVSKQRNPIRAQSQGQLIRVESDQNFVSVEFFVPSYSEPRRYTLKYKLEDYEQAWNNVTNFNEVTYSNLPSGHYQFRLRAEGINGDSKEATVSFYIAPPIWQTWWFIILSAIVISFLVMTIIRSYIRKAQYDRQRLEILLKIRTAEIERSKEELEILNQKKDLIFSILSHDLRSPLTTLKGFLGYLITHAHELSTDELKRHAVNIKNSVTNSLDLIDNTLFWSLSQMGNIQYSPTNFSLATILQKLQGLYQLTADKKRISLTVQCPDDIVVHGDENMVYVTLRNLVSNALKFTSEGKPVQIICKRWSDYVEIKVIDRGIGMSEEYLQKLMSMDQPMLKKGTSNEKGTGLGLLLCKKFVELNKGELLITSKENEGTTFTVILPLAVHQHATDQVLEK